MPTLHSKLAGVHGISAYLPRETRARRDLPVIVGDIFAAFLAGPTLRHVWVRFDRHALAILKGGQFHLTMRSTAKQKLTPFIEPATSLLQ